MMLRYRVYDPRSGSDPVKIRTLNHDVPTFKLSVCAWCKMNTLKPVVDVISWGMRRDQVATVCLCPLCSKSTIVYYEVPRVDNEGSAPEKIVIK